MPRKGFGTTWWGQSWVKALEAIDRDTSRLPRGRTYARNGSVLEISIQKDGKVIAIVRGSQPKPYTINIELKPWSIEKKKLCLKMFSERPDISSLLLIGQMPAIIEEELKNLGIEIFPSSWKSIAAKCSCPDWANPCKHRAAVYYIMANEIDKDPFLLFEMHGLKKAEIFDSAKLAKSSHKSLDWVFEDPPVHTELLALQQETLERADVTSCDVTNAYPIQKVLTLLHPEPLFDAGPQIAKLLPEAYRKVHEYWTMVADTEQRVLLSSQTNIKVVHREVDRNHGQDDAPAFFLQGGFENQNTSVFTLAEFIEFFRTVSLASDASDSASLASTKEILAFARRIIRMDSWVPQVFPVGEKGDFCIRYIPVFYDASLQKQKKTCDDTVLLGTVSAKPAILVQNERGQTLRADQSVDYFLQMFVSAMVHIAVEEKKIFFEQEMGKVFFKGALYQADAFQRKQTQNSLRNWLAPLYLTSTNHTLVILVKLVSHQKFQLVVTVKRKNDLFLNPMLVGDFIQNAAATEKESILKQIAYLSRWLPFLSQSFGSEPITIGVSELAEILSQSHDFLRFFGAELIIPKEFRDITRPLVTAQAKLKEKNLKMYMDLGSLLEYQWRVHLDDETLSMEEFALLIQGADRIIQFKDKYYLIDPTEARRMLERYMNPPDGSETNAFRALFTGEIEGQPLWFGKEIEDVLKRLRDVQGYELPKALHAQLRPYQVRGYQWMLTNLSNGFNVCLADDMGLGKTIQVITVLLKMQENGTLDIPVLVICPASVIVNWLKEIQRFAPSLKCGIYHGSDREPLSEEQVWITTYGTVREDIEELKTREWSVLIVDEAQNIKNPDADQSKAVRMLQSRYKIAMSGTPMENRVMELWSLFQFLMPGYLGKRKGFLEQVAAPIERFNDRQRALTLKKAIEPFLLRRLKTDQNVIKDLPEKLTKEEYVTLKPAQVVLYKRILETTAKEIEESEGMQRRGKVLWLLTALKQICNHPVSFTKMGDPAPELSGKAEKTMQLLQEIIERGEKALLFTQYREMGALLKSMVQKTLGFEPLFLHGGVVPASRQKLVEAFLADTVAKALADTVAKALADTVAKALADTVAKALADTVAKASADTVANNQEQPLHPIMIVTLKAGGTGLNLTAATHVIHYDLWWNPAVEAQATDRAYRIGQKKNVTVHRMLTQNTFEERINEMLISKKQLTDSVISVGERWITEMSDRDIRDLFSLKE